MIRYRDNDQANARAFRAQHLLDAALRLEREAEKLRNQAVEYRRIATGLNPTDSFGK